MSKQLVEVETKERIVTGSLDNRLAPLSVYFTVFILERTLIKITLTEKRQTITVRGYNFSATENSVAINGEELTAGLTSYEKLKLFVVPSNKMKTHYLLFPYHSIAIGDNDLATIKTKGTSSIILNKDDVIILPKEDLVYLNNIRVADEITEVEDFKARFRIFTPEFYLERRQTQWKLTTFSDDITLDYQNCFETKADYEFPTDFPEYRRSPRLLLEPPTENIMVDKIPNAPQPRKNSILKTLVPPLGMIATSVVMSSVSGRNPALMMVSALASIGTTVGAISANIHNKKEVKRKTIEREEDYDAYFFDKEAHISLQYQEEKKVLEYQQPSPKALASLAQKYDSRIYERMANNKDFLEVTLGLSEQPTNLKLSYPNDEQEKDPEMLRVKGVMKHYETQKNVPTKLELMNQTIGFVGTYDVLKTQVANLLFQAAFFQSYRDVNFITLVPEKEYKKDWHSSRFLPHYKLRELSNLRGLVHNAQSRDMVLNSFQRKLAERKQALEQAGREKPQFSPHYILTIFDDSYLAGHGINEYLAKDTSELGLTVIYCREDQRLLPETTTAVVEYFNSGAGQIINDHNLHVSTAFKPYREVPEMETAIRRIANLNHVEVEKNAIPKAVTFLEMYKVKKVEDLGIEQRWKTSNASKTLDVPIGLRGKDDLEMLNLHEKADGPHGIFGGTTGAGKSEMAQSLLLSLAVNYPPEDVSFLIIDFKGGGMSALFRKLPHLTGEITNLDGAGVQRAITAFQAELDKRQRLFDQFGVNNITDYTKLYRQGKETQDKKYPTEPLPHLIILGDETAELKAKASEFLEVLVSGARVGRSLGLHQLLGTQSPAGVISDQIWDNSKFKLSLRMADDEASKSILKTPDAAHLSTSLPGRAYLKVGTSERYELFQSAYSAADYNPNGEDDEVEVRDSRIWEIDKLGQTHLATKDLSESGEPKKKKSAEKYTELDAVVDYIAELVDKNKSKIPAKPWLPLLEEKIVTPTVEKTEERNTSIPLALMDIPSKQTQETYNYDVQVASHTAIFASPGYGKSTLLQTIVLNLARQNTPEQVQFNLLDFGTNGLLPLKDLPHTSDIVTLEEDEKLQKMFNGILDTLAVRKQLFKEIGVANLSQYERKSGTQLPIIISLLDNYDALVQSKRKDEIDNILLQILRDGASLGMYLIMTAGRPGSIRMNMASNIATKMSLFLNDDSELIQLFGRERLGQSEILGRAQIKVDIPTIMQIYLPAKGSNDSEMLEAIEQEIETINSSWDGARPEEIPMVSDKLSFADFETYIQGYESEDGIYLGVNKSTANLETFKAFNKQSIGFFAVNNKQAQLISNFYLQQFVQDNQVDKIILNFADSLNSLSGKVNAYLKTSDLSGNVAEIKAEIENIEKEGSKRLLIINGMMDFVSLMGYNPTQITSFFRKCSDRLQIVVLDSVSQVSHGYGEKEAVRNSLSMLIFGGELANQGFVENLPNEVKKEPVTINTLHVRDEDEFYSLIIPKEDE